MRFELVKRARLQAIGGRKNAVKAGSKVAEKSYPYIEDVGAWTARVYTAYEETHKKK